jgi:tetratricopeptide (TPR) repeat protein
MTKPPIPLIATLILFLFMLASYPLVLRLISQIYYQKAVNYARDGNYLPAIKDLEKAIHFQADNPLIWKRLGEAYHNLGKLQSVKELGEAYHNLGKLQSVKEGFAIAEKAKEAYLKASDLNPLDTEAAFALAREETRLKYLYPFLYPYHDHNPYYALPYFQKAIRLRPNGIEFHYAFAAYLYYHKKDKEFLEVIRELARICPLVYNRLKKEEFWAPSVREAVKRGVEKAVDEGIDPRNTHTILSSLLAEEKDWGGAPYLNFRRQWHIRPFLTKKANIFISDNFIWKTVNLKKLKRVL